jgi:hypothetical protein
MGGAKMPKTRRETKCDNESVEARTKNQKPGLYKIQQRFLLIFRPKTKVSLQNPIVSGLAFVNEFEPNF